MAAKHAEVIFETGEKSVIQYDDETELRAFVQEHVRRAKSGEKGGPTGHPAERISKVLLYDEHPGNYGESGILNVTSVESLITGLSSDNIINAWDLIAALRREINATHTHDHASTNAHDSLYKMPHVGELDLTNIGGNPGSGSDGVA